MEIWNICFNLSSPSLVEALSEEGSAKVSVKKGDDKLSVTGIIAGGEVEATCKAQKLANKFLDVLSWKYSTHLAIVSYPIKVDHTSANGQQITDIRVEEIGVLSEQFSLVKKDSSGNIIEERDSTKPGKIELGCSKAAPYFRQAQLSRNSFDRFRNFYLVAENIASQIQLENGLEAGLKECFRGQEESLRQVARDVPTFNPDKELFSEVNRILYKEYRCQLNHSKASKHTKVPFDPQDEERVQAALPLMEFIARSFLEYEERSLNMLC